MRFFPLLVLLAGCGQVRISSGLRVAQRDANRALQAVPPPERVELPQLAPLACDPPKTWHYNHYLCCQSAEQIVPSSEAEAIVRFRDHLRQEKSPIHVLGAIHSGSSMICTTGTVMLLSKLNHALRIDDDRRGHASVVVEAGMTIVELNEWLHARGYSLGMATLEFRDATVGGAIATGAHGSSLKESSVLSSRVEGLWMVTPADVARHPELREAIEYTEASVGAQTFAAMRAGLGLFGLVTRVRLTVEPEFGLDTVVTFGPGAEVTSPGGLQKTVGDCDWGQILWFPFHDRYVAMCGRRAPLDKVDANAENTLLDPRAVYSDVMIFESILDMMVRSHGSQCPEWLREMSLSAEPPLAKKCGLIRSPTRRAVGFAARMMSSRLLEYQVSVPQNDFEMAVPLANAAAALGVVRDEVKKSSLCLPLTGVFLRFSRADPKLLIAHSAADTDMPAGSPLAYIEYVVYRPRGSAVNAGDLVFGPYWRLTESLLQSAGGRMHWGKNQQDLFKTQRELNAPYADRLRRFRAIRQEFDPQHRMATPFSDAVGLTAE